MAKIDVVNTEGKKVSERDLPDDLFSVPINPGILHDVVTMQLAARRSGTASTKGRSDVHGTNAKPYRQKGTGRARQGDVKSPLLKGGGVVFGPTPRSYAQKMPKKVKRLALKMALSSKLAEDKLIVVDKIALDAPKTKDFVAITKALNVNDALIVVDTPDTNLMLSVRNLPKLKMLPVQGLNVYDILKYDHLVLIEPSVPQIEGRLEK